MSEPLEMNVDFEMSDTEMNLEADMNCNIEVPLPIASATQLGGIKVGENLSIADDGTLSAEASPVAVDDTLAIAGAAADAKKTGDEISGLKEELTDATGVTLKTGWQTGKRIATNTNPISFTPDTHSAWSCIVVDCAEGDVFTLTAKGNTSTYRIYCFTKNDGAVVEVPTSNLDWTKHKLVTPTGATKLVCNSLTSVSYKLYSGIMLGDEIEQIEEKLAYGVTTKYTDSTELVATAVSPIDLDDITTPGNYYISAESVPYITNLPNQAYGRLTVMTLSAAARIVQIYTQAGSGVWTFIRGVASISPLTFGEWRKIAMTSDVEEMAKYNSILIHAFTTQKAETTVNGITYTIVDGVVTLTGTATAKTLVNLEGSATSVPSWITNGKFYVNIHKTAIDNVEVMIDTYKSGLADEHLFASGISGYFSVGDVTQYSGIIIRLNIPKGASVSNTISLEILSAPPNSEIERKKPTKMRFMQYNCGHYNMGHQVHYDDPSERDVYYLTDENYEDILNSYKRIFGDYQPDIIGVEEAENSVIVKNGDTTETTVNLNTALYTPLYPHGFFTGTKSALSLKSKYPYQSAKSAQIDYEYTYDGTTKSAHINVVYTLYIINNVKIAVVVTAFPPSDNALSAPENLLKKEGAYNAVSEMLADDDNAIIICDANADPQTLDTIMQDVTGMHSYNRAMGSYFPNTDTYESDNNHQRAQIDNLFYKGTSIQLVNFKSLMTEYENLASDHVPVYADFLIT